ncbi:MAG: sporulation protein YunB [Oscillospiraceae bacterium]|nr:sporulation protein YunB [Oscillospiraceae bacterium]
MTKRNKWALRIIAVGMMLIGVTILMDLQIRPIILKAASYQCQVMAARIINQTMLDELGDNSYDYENLVSLRYGEGGEVRSLESNMQNMNRLKAQSNQAINEAIRQIGESDIQLQLGTVSGVYMFHGRGPSIPVTLTPIGYAQTTLISDFSAAGMNQTLHRIIMKVKVELSAIIPGYTSAVLIEHDFIVAETIIVGNIPESYTHIILGGI